MKATTSFSEILEDILETPSVSGASANSFSLEDKNFNAGWESAIDPFGLSQIIAETSIYRSAGRAYKTPPRVVVPRPGHMMNAEQKCAFETLKSFVADFQDNFTAAELRSCYRQALLKTHPDQGGSSESFWATKKSYEMLKSLVTS